MTVAVPPSIFTRIIHREIPGHFLYEDELCVVILDKFPAVKGQSLVIPKQETDYLFAVDDSIYRHLFLIAKKVALASDMALETVRTCLVVEGFDVPHVHIKLYPLTSTARPLGAIMPLGQAASDAELAQVAKQIRAYLH